VVVGDGGVHAATGQRIGECLAVLWFEVDLQAGRVDVSSTVIRWTGHGLVRKSTKSKARERSLRIPSWMVTELQLRRSQGVRMDEPVFANSLGGLRDPKNTRRDVRRALDQADFCWVTSHSFRKTTARILEVTRPGSPHASSLISWVMQGLR
jgi:integrase